MGSTALYCSSDLTASLGFYEEGSRQPLHSHSTPTVSILLSGSVHEAAGGQDCSATLPSISIKPPDVRHSDVYGRNGAIILSIAVHDDSLWAATALPETWGWHSLSYRSHHETLASIGSSPNWTEIAFELLALGAPVETRKGQPPLWLASIAEQIAEEPHLALAGLATRAGIHPVYLARAFRSWYGMSPSAFRLSQRTSAAIRIGLSSNRTAAGVAHDLGFSDQSHMARSVRSATGHSLTQLRRLALKCYLCEPSRDLISVASRPC